MYVQLSIDINISLASRGQTLLSRRGVIAFNISAPLEKGSGRFHKVYFRIYKCVDLFTYPMCLMFIAAVCGHVLFKSEVV